MLIHVHVQATYMSMFYMLPCILLYMVIYLCLYIFIHPCMKYFTKIIFCEILHTHQLRIVTTLGVPAV